MATDEVVHDAIQADPEAKGLADAGNDAGAAARVAAILPKILVSTSVTDRGIFAALVDPDAGEAFMQGLAAVAGSKPSVKRAIAWLEPANGGVDMANPAVRGMLDQMQGAGALTAEAVATLKALAERPDTVSADQVSRVWLQYRADGRIA